MRKIIWWLVNNTLEKQAMQPLMYMSWSLRQSAASIFGNFKKREYLRIFGLSSELFGNLWKKKCSGDICNFWKGSMIFGRVKNHAFIFSYLSKTQGKLWLLLKYSRWQFSVCINLVICTELQFCTCVHILSLSYISTALFIANQKGIFQVYY